MLTTFDANWQKLAPLLAIIGAVLWLIFFRDAPAAEQAMFAALLVIYMVLRRLIIGPEVEGIFTLFAILFFLLGVVITGLGIVGEYVGRIYQQVRARARFRIRTIHEKN